MVTIKAFLFETLTRAILIVVPSRSNTHIFQILVPIFFGILPSPDTAPDGGASPSGLCKHGLQDVGANLIVHEGHPELLAFLLAHAHQRPALGSEGVRVE